jgi:O-antigen/teichoic acid export membrane protein
MTALARAARHGALYAGFQVLGLLLSLVSFPILTRILSVEEYGQLSLFTAITALLVALAKCGITTSFVRSYAATPAAGRTALYSSALAVNAGLALGVAALFALGLHWAGSAVDRLLASILQFTWAFLFFSTLRELLLIFLRAEERSFALSVIGLVVKVGDLALGIVGCVVLALGLPGFVGGNIAFEALAVVALCAHYARRGLLRPAAARRPVAAELLAYGAPLMLYELSWLANQYFGRFALDHYEGAAAVGIFSVGYNLAAYVLTLVNTPMSMAIFPIYTKLWENEGAPATTAFLSTVLRAYIAGATLVIAGMSATSADLIALLATPRFAAAATVVPFVITSVLLYGTTLISGAGYHLQRRTREFAVLMLACAALNVGANVALVPPFGMLGSAYATLISYGALTVLITLRARRLLPVPWPLRLGLCCALAALAAWACALQVHLDHALAELLVRSAVVTLVYAALALALDAGLRRLARQALQALARRLRRGSAGR